MRDEEVKDRSVKNLGRPAWLSRADWLKPNHEDGRRAAVDGAAGGKD